MTIKLALLKSGEDLIAEVQEMVYEERVIGYYFTKPCIVKMRNKDIEPTEKGPNKAEYQVFLYPWLPLTTDERIPVPADWIVTLVTPTPKLEEMYTQDIINYTRDKKDDKTNIVIEQSDIDQSN